VPGKPGASRRGPRHSRHGGAHPNLGGKALRGHAYAPHGLRTCVRVACASVELRVRKALAVCPRRPTEQAQRTGRTSKARTVVRGNCCLVPAAAAVGIVASGTTIFPGEHNDDPAPFSMSPPENLKAICTEVKVNLPVRANFETRPQLTHNTNVRPGARSGEATGSHTQPSKLIALRRSVVFVPTPVRQGVRLPARLVVRALSDAPSAPGAGRFDRLHPGCADADVYRGAADEVRRVRVRARALRRLTCAG